MPARKRTWTPQIVRERMRTAAIVNRLQKHIMGEVEMTQTQVSAALGLLRKTLPDLAAIEHKGEVDTRFVIAAPMPAENAQEWVSQHAPKTTQ